MPELHGRLQYFKESAVERRVRVLGRLLTCGLSICGPVSCLGKDRVPEKTTMFRGALRSTVSIPEDKPRNCPAGLERQC